MKKRIIVDLDDSIGAGSDYQANCLINYALKIGLVAKLEEYDT
jgi:hypothetical protein